MGLDSAVNFFKKESFASSFEFSSNYLRLLITIKNGSSAPIIKPTSRAGTEN